MASGTEGLNDFFSIPGATSIPIDILGELQSILRLHSIAPQELFYKWESYCIKMGSEETKLDLSTVRAFKKDIQEMLERESKGRSHMRSADKRGLHATPRAAAGHDDMFGMWVSSKSKSGNQLIFQGWMVLHPGRLELQLATAYRSVKLPSRLQPYRRSSRLRSRAHQQMAGQKAFQMESSTSGMIFPKSISDKILKASVICRASKFWTDHGDSEWPPQSA